MTDQTDTACGLPHHDYPETRCNQTAGHAGSHAAPWVIDGRECGAVAWDPPGETRTACPHCGLPHDLDLGSLAVAVCASTRRRIADAAQLHEEGNHGLCCRADCTVLQQRAADEQPAADQTSECTASVSGHCLREAESETACDTGDGECVHGGRPAVTWDSPSKSGPKGAPKDECDCDSSFPDPCPGREHLPVVPTTDQPTPATRDCLMGRDGGRPCPASDPCATCDSPKRGIRHILGDGDLMRAVAGSCDSHDGVDSQDERRSRWEAAAHAAGREVDRNALAAYMAVADAELERLRAERDMLGRDADRLRRDWVEMRERATVAEAERARLRARVAELEARDTPSWRQRAEQAEAELAEARSWARHGYEIGQRHCGWTDHGVAPAWLTEGWPPHFDSCEHLQLLSEAEATIARVRQAADRLADGTETGFRAALTIRDEADQPGTDATDAVVHLVHQREDLRHQIRDLRAENFRLTETIKSLRADLGAETELRQERTELYDLWRRQCNELDARMRSFFEDMATWCSPHGVAVDYAQRGLAALDQPKETRP